MRIAIRGHDVVAAGSLNNAIIAAVKRTAAGPGASPGPVVADPFASLPEGVVQAAEHIANMSDEELRQICQILHLDLTGSHKELSDRVLAHTDLEAVAAAVTQVKTPKPDGSHLAQDFVLHEMTVAQLKEHAKVNGIDLGGATTKQQIIDVIKAHSAPK